MIEYTLFQDSKITFTDEGKGDCVVLLHGFLGSLDIWKEFSQKLSGRFRVVAIDLPGHGSSDSIGDIHTMELMANCIKAVLDHLQIKKSTLVGHSMGGYAALSFAELFPKNVSGLCLFHSTALPDSPERKEARKRAIEAVKNNHKQFTYEFIPQLFAPENTERLKDKIRHLQDIASGMSKQAIVNALDGMKERTDKQEILREADFPVLFIAGKKDLRIPLEEILPQIELCKHKHSVILDNSGHMGFYEEENKTPAVIYRFAEQVFISLLPEIGI